MTRAASATDPAKSAGNPNNPAMTAGFTFLGQFVDHAPTRSSTPSSRQGGYVLREAEGMANGERLGPVGGRIVAEVIIGVIRGDRQSYLRQEPDWTPIYGTGGSFATVDLLRTAGVVATL
jgi:hypothetical protein